MTIFTIIRSLCGMRINDVSKWPYGIRPEGSRGRYSWVCAKQRCKPCSESSCPAMKKIAALENLERRKTVKVNSSVVTNCPDCNGAGKIECEDQSEWVNTTQYYQCPKCCGTGKL